MDCAERTSELENINSQLQKAKHDGVTAVEKLKKCEEDLSHIKEKNAQLSDEILSKSRQIAAMENSNKGAIRKTSLPAGPMSSAAESKTVADLRKQVADLEQKVAAASSGNAVGGGAKKKSVKFAEVPVSTDSR